MGGCCASRPTPPPDLLPAFCVKPELNARRVALVRESWQRCLEGTAAYRAARPPESVESGIYQPSSTAAGDDTGTPLPATSRTRYTPLVFLYELFYTELFSRAPQIRPLFKSSIKVQGRALIFMVSYIVEHLESKELMGHATALARRHVAYGASWDQYGLVGEVLVHTLKLALGDEWTPECADAWTHALSALLSITVPAHWEEQQRQMQRHQRGGAGKAGKGAGAVSPAPTPWAAAAAAEAGPRPAPGSSASFSMTSVSAGSTMSMDAGSSWPAGGSGTPVHGSAAAACPHLRGAAAAAAPAAAGGFPVQHDAVAAAAAPAAAPAAQ